LKVTEITYGDFIDTFIPKKAEDIDRRIDWLKEDVFQYEWEGCLDLCLGHKKYETEIHKVEARVDKIKVKIKLK
jgi:hypothetical protein